MNDANHPSLSAPIRQRLNRLAHAAGVRHAAEKRAPGCSPSWPRYGRQALIQKTLPLILSKSKRKHDQ